MGSVKKPRRPVVGKRRRRGPVRSRAPGRDAPPAPRALTRVTKSEAETRALGERLGRLLEPGDFVGLIGPMGAGKTTFVRGVADGLGVKPGEVASPTFAIVYPYRGRITVNHVDLYRVTDADELYATGYFDLIDGAEATIVEWLDRIPEAAPPERLEIHFQDLGGDRRALTLRPRGARSRTRAYALLQFRPGRATADRG